MRIVCSPKMDVLFRTPVSRMMVIKRYSTVTTALHYAAERGALTLSSCLVVGKPHYVVCRQVQNRSLSTVNQSSSLKPFDAIPGPKGLPFFGTAFQYMKPNGKGFNKMFEVFHERSKEFGPIFKERLGPNMTFVVISDINEYSKVMQVDGKFPVRIETDPMVLYCKKKKMKLDIANSQGEEWYRYRKILGRKMLPPAEIAKYIEPMDQVSQDFVSRLDKLQTQSRDHSIFDVQKEIFKLALESIGSVVFEDRIGCLEDPVPRQAEEFITNVNGVFLSMQDLYFGVKLYKLFPTKAWKKFETHFDHVYEIGRMFVDKKLQVLQKQMTEELETGQNKEKSEFLSYLLTQKELTIQEVSSNAIGVLSAAVDSTSNALLWILYCLARNPDVQEAVHRDIETVLPNRARVTVDSLQQLSLVKACLKEAMRLYPVSVGVLRNITKDIECFGYHIPAGTTCQGNIYSMGRDERLFPDAEKYRPQRWLRGENTDGRMMTISSLVFGHGPRMCLGRRLAEQEVYIAITKILQNFKLEYNGEEVQPVMLTFLTPDRPVNISFIPRAS